jgi:hypothetical protein
MAYLDTSVLIPYYWREPSSDVVQEVIGQDSDPVITGLVKVEFAAALAMKVRLRETDEASARRVSSLLNEHLEEGRYEVVPIEQPEYDLAYGWIGRYSVPIRAPDALHLAAAFTHDMEIVTADKPLARAAKLFGVAARLIE